MIAYILISGKVIHLNTLEINQGRILKNVQKSIYTKCTANIVLNGERLNVFPLRSGAREELLLSPLLFNIALSVLLEQ